MRAERIDIHLFIILQVWRDSFGRRDMDDIRLELDKIFHSLSFSHDAFAFPHARPAGR